MIELHEVRRQVGRMPAVADVENERVAKALAGLARLVAAYDEAVRLEGVAEKALEEAKRKDRRALAEAMKGGKADPGKKKLEAATGALEDARRRREASEVAAGGAHADVVATVEASRAAWLETLAGRLAEQRKWFEVELGELEAAYTAMGKTEALERWVRGFPHVAKLAPAGHRLEGLVGRNGEAYMVAAVLEALRETFGAEAPELAGGPAA